MLSEMDATPASTSASSQVKRSEAAEDGPSKDPADVAMGRHPELAALGAALAKLSLAEQLEPQARAFFRAMIGRTGRFEDHSAKNRRRYKYLRLPTFVAAAVIPPLVALDLGRTGRIATAALAVGVAIGTASEAFFAAGQRWQQLRATAELMKIEAWMYVALGGGYARFAPADHTSAFATFAERIESIWRREVEEYVDVVTQARLRGHDRREQNSGAT